MPKISVVAAVVDTKQLTLYKEDGNTVMIPQGDERLAKILKEITPVISQGQIAYIDLDPNNAYKQFEEESGGLVRFYRIAKKRVANFFNTGSDPVAPTVLGNVPDYLGVAIDDIMAHATPVSDGSFSESETKSSETMIAVMGEGADRKVIPGMENIRGQFDYANKLGSPKGVQNFLRRISAVIDQRKHSIHDLLRFMEKGDLPIADDGSIIIYKILRRVHDKNGYYKDCHSGNVEQRIGSYVCMDPSMVDPNRRNECSNGLHVARRGYLSGFLGDVCVLAKLAPEDVIAVPDYDANKMRVCGYHIIFEIVQEDFTKLKNNQAMTDNMAAQRQLGRAISGDHIGKIEEVRITQGNGGGLVVTLLTGDGGYGTARKYGSIQGKDAPLATAIENNAAMAPAVDPKAVAKEVTAAKAAAPTPVVEAAKPNLDIVVAKTGTKQATARDLFKAGNFAGLLVFKKEAKKGWSALSITEAEVDQVMAEPYRFNNPVPKPTPRPKAKVADKVIKQPKITGKKATSVIFDELTNVAPAVRLTPNQLEARVLFNKKAWKRLATVKKFRKKSWQALGFTEGEEATIKSNLKG